MKVRVILAALVLVGSISSCAVRTCPTYSKEDIKKVEKAAEERV